MLRRTKRVTLTFQNPFSLKGVERRLAPGQYEVVTDEELIDELSFPVYRRVATLIFLPAEAYQRSSIEMVKVDPSDLVAAHERDQATTPTAKERAGVTGGLDRTDFSVVVKNRARMPKPWRWEIYRAGRQSPVARSKDFFESRSTASMAGNAALGEMMKRMRF
jgi:hypothetical protein